MTRTDASRKEDIPRPVVVLKSCSINPEFEDGKLSSYSLNFNGQIAVLPAIYVDSVTLVDEHGGLEGALESYDEFRKHSNSVILGFSDKVRAQAKRNKYIFKTGSGFKEPWKEIISSNCKDVYKSPL